jgi:hypothetical protein
LSNGNRQHRIMPDRVQKAVGLRAVDHAGPSKTTPGEHGLVRLKTADGEPRTATPISRRHYPPYVRKAAHARMSSVALGKV